MKIFLTGANGQLGRELQKRLQGSEFLATDMQELDITNEAAVSAMIGQFRPDAVIHGAAWTQVDAAEEKPDLAWRVNAIGTQNIAMACRDCGAKMVYISTDYVFPGDGDVPYETDAPKGPKNVYGKSKLMGEEAVQSILKRYFIVRISWVFGINGKNFIRTMLRLGESHAKLTVVDDQVGSPTYTRDLSVLLADMVQTERYGVYHATNEGFCSWAELAAEVFRQAGMPVEVTPVPSSAYPTRAVRPKNSRMSKKSLTEAGFALLPRWQDAVGRYLIELESLKEQREALAE